MWWLPPPPYKDSGISRGFSFLLFLIPNIQLSSNRLKPGGLAVVGADWGETGPRYAKLEFSTKKFSGHPSFG